MDDSHFVRERNAFSGAVADDNEYGEYYDDYYYGDMAMDDSMWLDDGMQDWRVSDHVKSPLFHEYDHEFNEEHFFNDINGHILSKDNEYAITKKCHSTTGGEEVCICQVQGKDPSGFFNNVHHCNPKPVHRQKGFLNVKMPEMAPHWLPHSMFNWLNQQRIESFPTLLPLPKIHELNEKHMFSMTPHQVMKV